MNAKLVRILNNEFSAFQFSFRILAVYAFSSAIQHEFIIFGSISVQTHYYVTHNFPFFFVQYGFNEFLWCFITNIFSAVIWQIWFIFDCILIKRRHVCMHAWRDMAANIPFAQRRCKARIPIMDLLPKSCCCTNKGSLARFKISPSPWKPCFISHFPPARQMQTKPC